jgi:hypothetical protein
LVARAGELAQGNIGAARAQFERAVEMGNARASFVLGDTYDPHVLSAWKAYSTRGDASTARALYSKAMVGGIGVVTGDPEAQNLANEIAIVLSKLGWRPELIDQKRLDGSLNLTEHLTVISPSSNRAWDPKIETEQVFKNLGGCCEVPCNSADKCWASGLCLT